MAKNDGGPAFGHGNPEQGGDPGMTLHQYYIGQALANPAICTGEANDYLLRRWFGERGGITRPEIIAKQAQEAADAMIAAREADQ